MRRDLESLEHLEEVFLKVEAEYERRARADAEAETASFKPAGDSTRSRKRKARLSVSRLGEGVLLDVLSARGLPKPSTACLTPIASKVNIYQTQNRSEGSLELDELTDEGADAGDFLQLHDDHQITRVHRIAARRRIAGVMIPRRIARLRDPASLIADRGEQDVEIGVSVQTVCDSDGQGTREESKASNLSAPEDPALHSSLPPFSGLGWTTKAKIFARKLIGIDVKGRSLSLPNE